MARLALALLCLVLCVGVINAKDYSNSPNHQWFEGLTNQDKMPCCDVADGQRIEDADWRSTADGHYQVKLNDQWVTVPDHAVINPRNRPVDFAMVWLFKGMIMCFMAGSGS